MVRWEVAARRIRSCCDRTSPEGIVSSWHYGILRSYALAGLDEFILDEFRLEEIRAEHYPHCVSRLTGLYFFESRETAFTAIDRWGIDSELKEYVTPVNFSASNATRVDSEWITRFKGQGVKSTDWIHAYWRGESYGDNRLTEVLASGIGLIDDSQFALKCFRDINALSPVMAKLLMLGIVAMHSGYPDLVQAIPIINRDGNKISGNYYLDARELRATTTINWDDAHARAFEAGFRFGNLPNLEIPNDIEFPDFGMKFDFEFSTEATH